MHEKRRNHVIFSAFFARIKRWIHMVFDFTGTVEQNPFLKKIAAYELVKK
jgi:hypothetical protein